MSAKFVCPNCGETRIECCLDGPHSVEVTDIEENGDFDFAEYQSTAQVDRFQCLNCGFVIVETINNSFPCPLTEQDEVAQWCLDNCSQE